jgi:hypothetical protein
MRRSLSGLVVLLAACDEPDHWAFSSSWGKAGALWLESSGAPRFGGEGVVELRGGSAPITGMLRNGDMQWNEVAFTRGDSGLTATFRPAAGGHALAAATVVTGDELPVRVHLKTVFLVGGEPPIGSAALVAAAVGQPLELVPLVDPLVLGPGDLLPIRLRADDGDVAGHPVRIETFDAEQAAWRALAEQHSGAGGRIDVELPHASRIRVTVLRAASADAAQLVFPVGGAR